MRTDLNYLKSMSGEDPDLMAEMIDIFNEQVLDLRKEMQEMLNKKDYHALGKVAHKAKTSVAIMGMEDLAKDLKELENLAKESREIKSYQQYIDDFDEQTNQAIHELKDFKNHLT
jgi:HPt (histidine-containing phosphotransfer) domain-containing protein